MRPGGSRPYLLYYCAALALVAVSACAGVDVGRGATSPRARAAAPAPPPPPAPTAEIELVESAPVETTLDHADVRDADTVWVEMIDGATASVDLAAFYASEPDEDAARAESRLAPVVAALDRAAGRGVRVRVLADKTFAATYPDTLARFERSGIEVRRLDVTALMGGVLHAKYFVVDGAHAFVGSQNFDWRALSHIQEIGVRVRSRAVGRALLDVFETDWALAGGAPPDARVREAPPSASAITTTGETVIVTASPDGWLPDPARWDLPRLVALLDGATRSVDLQLLSYTRKSRDGSPFPTLDDALRRAAARGVRIRLLVSEWGAKPDSDGRAAIEALAALPSVEVRVLVIPPWSGGEIPFARVAHAKYLVLDGTRAWVGTSNWAGDYFTKSRNVGLEITGGALPGRLARIFEDGWSSGYARPLAPAGAR